MKLWAPENWIYTLVCDAIITNLNRYFNWWVECWKLLFIQLLFIDLFHDLPQCALSKYLMSNYKYFKSFFVLSLTLAFRLFFFRTQMRLICVRSSFLEKYISKKRYQKDEFIPFYKTLGKLSGRFFFIRSVFWKYFRKCILPEAATVSVLRNFAKFTGKHLHQSLFNKVADTAPLGDCFYSSKDM